MCVVKKKILLAFAVSLLFLGNVKAQDTLSLTLDKAIEIALSENPTIKVAGPLFENSHRTANTQSELGRKRRNCRVRGRATNPTGVLNDLRIITIFYPFSPPILSCQTPLPTIRLPLNDSNAIGLPWDRCTF